MSQPSSTREPRARSPHKQQLIVRTLRQQIIDGRLAPGDQLPTRSALEKRFGVSSNTLQRALDRLIGQGFVYAQGTAGTFVSPRPPHLMRYGVLVPRHGAASPPRNRFLQAMIDQAHRRDAQGPQRFELYHVGNGRNDKPQRQQLIEHVRDHRLAGLIFLVAPAGFTDTPVLDAPYPGRVAVNAGPSAVASVVSFDWHLFLERALQVLAARGRRRVALICGSGLHARLIKPWLSAADAFGLRSCEAWVQGVDVSYPLGARHVAQLMMMLAPAQRPDGLVIADDNLAEHAAAGLLAAGAKVPEQLEVVSHCNFPWPTPSVLPTHRLGFDARSIFDLCVNLAQKQRADRTAPQTTLARPVFEHELTAEPQALTEPQADAGIARAAASSF